MAKNDPWRIDRRGLLRSGMFCGAVLVIPATLGAATPKSGTAPHTPDVFAPNAWVRIHEDGSITLTMAQIEMGQGAQTGLAMIIAEELDVALDDVRIEQAIADKARYGNQITGGSTSIREGWMPMRKAGATARKLLVTAAANRWKVDPGSCSTRDAMVVHAETLRSASYGSLVAEAAQLPTPSEVPLKDPKLFKLLGKPAPRVEGATKVTGAAVFGIDANIPGHRVAALAQSPVFGGLLESVDERAAMAIPGVIQIVRLDDAVAVVADSMITAQKGLEALIPGWTDGPLADLGSAKIYADLDAAVEVSGFVANRVGSPEKIQGRTITASYRQPFLAHAPMEPMSCTAHVTKTACEIWTGTQTATDAREAVAKLLKLPIENVRLNVYLMGGGFGRRLEFDGIIRAVQIASKVDGPVHVIWSRQEDMQHDLYRPAYADRISATLGEAGLPIAWTHRIAGSSIMARLYPDQYKGFDIDAVDCAIDPIYTLPNKQIEYTRVECGVPTSWWRGVGPLRSLFVVESFIDELAAAVKQDPFRYRQALISDKRAARVLELAVEKAEWGKPLPQGWGRGISVQSAFGSYTALIAEISLEAEGAVRLRRIIAAIDCGRAINPDMICAQIEGGTIFGASAAMLSEITISRGRVEEGNFMDYPMLTMATAPKVEVHIVESSENPGGVGETATAGIAPAIANAIFAASGQRIRTLPIARSCPIWSA